MNKLIALIIIGMFLFSLVSAQATLPIEKAKKINIDNLIRNALAKRATIELNPPQQLDKSSTFKSITIQSMIDSAKLIDYNTIKEDNQKKLLENKRLVDMICNLKPEMEICK